MASTLKDNVSRWKKKLERNTDEYTILSVIHKLSKVSVTVDLLQDTGIGKVIRTLAKEPGKVGEKASALLRNWRKVVTVAQKSSEYSPKASHEKHNSLKLENSGKVNSDVINHHVPSPLSFEKKSSKEKRSLELKYEQESENGSFKSKDILSKPSPKLNLLHSNTKKNCVDKYKEPHDVPDDNMIEYGHHSLTSDPDSEEIYSNRKRKDSDRHSSQDMQPKTKKVKISKDSISSHDSSLKKEKDERCHNSNGQTDRISSDSQSHKHANKDPSSKKLKESKPKKVKDGKKNSDLKKTLKMQSTDAFTSSEVRFEDCLSFNDIVTVKRKKSSKTSSNTSSTKSKAKSSSEKKKRENEVVESKHSNQSRSKPSVKESKPKENKKEKDTMPLIVPLPKSMDIIDIASTLPQPQLNYKPLPQRNFSCYPVKKKALSNEDAIKFTSSRKEKTAVYSGRKHFLTAVPTLQESCTRILIENIDAIEYLGGLPYYLLKPVLDRCTPQQLENIEDYNPHFLEDTHELWEMHCKKDFRALKPQENETWRDLYLRAFEEREKRLKAITKNISDSMSRSNTGRIAKLTYVNSYVKPPRDVARKQERNGTGLPVNHTMKAGPPSKATPRPTAPAINSAATSNAKSDHIPKNNKPKVAPLMAKTLKSMKQCFRR